MDPDLLQPGMHIIWLDNLFTKIRLLEELREVGIGAAGTVRPLGVVTPREIRLEKARQREEAKKEKEALKEEKAAERAANKREKDAEKEATRQEKEAKKLASQEKKGGRRKKLT